MNGSHERLRSAVHAYNAEHIRDGWTVLGLGIVWTIASFLIFWCIAWMIGTTCGSAWLQPPWLFATVVTGAYALAAVWSAWRDESPVDRVLREGTTLGEDIVDGFLALAGSGSGVYPRMGPYLAAGTSALIGGPANIFEGRRMLGTRLWSSDDAIEAAHGLFILSAQRCTYSTSIDGRAVVMLHKLGLITLRKEGLSGVEISITLKGLDLLQGSASNPR
ncbi:MAG TPA: hypothetical protein VG711_01845 [Phycisphaerales bacterium]|nr:hypothetical protein [Phycisphaerales bacterium]